MKIKFVTDTDVKVVVDGQDKKAVVVLAGKEIEVHGKTITFKSAEKEEVDAADKQMRG